MLGTSGTSPALEVIPLGGVGEFGMNMMLFVSEEAAIVVDAGVMFPGPELPGVDLVIPDLSHLRQFGDRLVALVLTHGHEDHIGAVPYVAPFIHGPIYGTPLTLALLKTKLEEHGIDTDKKLTPVNPRESITIGDLTIEFFRVTHSMPDCLGLAIHSPIGTVIHTGDFKIDQTPIDGDHIDLRRLGELGESGVLALFGDSTNVDRKGFTGSEIEVIDAFKEIFTSTKGKIVVTTFSSSIHRIQILINLAVHFDRKVVFAGRGMKANSSIAADLGRLHIPPGIQIRDTQVVDHRPCDVLCITTGSQGEPSAALSRIATNDHRHIKLTEDDVVVFSARAIPGNEKAISEVMNHIARRGTEIIYEGLKHVHVSGHGSEEELKLMLSLTMPTYFIPIHGEYRQLAQHARIAGRATNGKSTPLLVENGDVLRFDSLGAHVTGKVPAGRILIDRTRTGEIRDEVLRDRRHLAGDGLIVPVITINKQTGSIEGNPDLSTRGFVVDERTEKLLCDVPGILNRIIEGASIEELTDHDLIKEKIQVELRRFFRKRSGRRPLVLPVIVEI